MADGRYWSRPNGDEIKEVEATADKACAAWSQGWHQVPAPAGTDP